MAISRGIASLPCPMMNVTALPTTRKSESALTYSYHIFSDTYAWLTFFPFSIYILDSKSVQGVTFPERDVGMYSHERKNNRR